ncbi:unnamed protein product [Camellia sinensis]
MATIMSSSQIDHLHFILIPLMSPGHLLPMIDMAKLLSHHGVTVTIVTTPLNTARFISTIPRAVESGHRIRLLELPFPATTAGLPEGCENMDSLPSRSSIKSFFVASSMLQKPFEEAFHELKPPPSCIISGKNLAWTVETARKFRIPRFFFDGMGCFAFSCTHNMEVSKVHETVSEFESFVVPGLPHRVELTRARLPESLNPGSTDLIDVRNEMISAESVVDGILINTFEELELDYVKQYRKIKGCKIWCIGPVSACNKLSSEKAERGGGGKDAIYYLKWLDAQEPNSVIYACLGSICGLTGSQLKELGLGLEKSNKSFIWVIRGGQRSLELEKWLADEKFEERNKDRGLLIRDWAPQVLILSHPAIGGFLTHCGWNSTTEGVSSGVPMVTCPLFAEQFINEKLVVEVLAIGVSVRVERAVTWGMEDKCGVVMRRENVKEAIEKVMERGKEGEERRKRAREVGEMAKRAIEEGGSSYLNIKMFIQDVLHLQHTKIGSQLCE